MVPPTTHAAAAPAAGANALVIAGVESLTGPETRAAAEQARLSSPEAFLAREESQTKFEGLDPSQAASLASASFPQAITQAEAPPQLPSGAAITGYLSDDAAKITLPEGKHALLESMSPIAMETSPGHREAIDLALTEAHGSFQAVRAPLPLEIPKHLNQGLALPGSGVSLTPLDARGHALGGAPGEIADDSVYYGGAGASMDVALKPTVAGVEIDAILRGPAAPRKLYLRVGMPRGAHLVEARGGSAVEVTVEGALLATLLPPAAVDAAGSAVPVSMSVEGHELVLSVDAAPSSIQYPLLIDPRAEDHQLWATITGKKSNWTFKPNGTAFQQGGCDCGEGVGKEEGILTVSASGASYAQGEGGNWIYQTHGDSDIFQFTGSTYLANYFVVEENGQRKAVPNYVASWFELDGPPGVGQEAFKELMNDVNLYEGSQTTPICPKTEGGVGSECSPGSGHAENTVQWDVAASKPCTGCSAGEDLTQASVLIYEPPNSVTSEFNKTTKTFSIEPEIEGKRVLEKRNNVLDPEAPGDGWLSESEGAIEGIAHGNGTGVAAARLEYEYAPGHWERLPGLERNYYAEGRCTGVQCGTENANHEFEGIQREVFTLPMIKEQQRLPNGEDRIRWQAESTASESASSNPEGEETVKVETSKPHTIELQGLPEGGQLSERPYEVTAEATDGESPLIAASGIRSISLYIKGKSRVGEPKEGTEKPAPESSGEGFCTKPKGECTAHAKFTISAEQMGQGPAQIVVEAENYAGNKARESFSVSVHHSAPVSLGPGSLDLQSGDFALGATDVSEGGGLTVSRTYSSRDTTVGASGPLGPQWLISAGNDESLQELYGGSMMLIDQNGQETVFLPQEKKVGEKEEQVRNSKGELEYESPKGDSNIDLTAEEKEGQKVALYVTDPSADTQVKFTHPSGSPEGSKNWLPTVGCSRFEEETTTSPYKCAATNTTTFAFQYVPPQTTEYSLPSGSKPYNITAGAEGNVWETDDGTSSVDMVTPAGKVTEHAVLGGSMPFGITQGPGGSIWFTELETGKIGTVTPAGKVLEYSLPEKTSKPNSIALGPEGDLWFTECGSGKVGRITTSGELVGEYALPAGGCPGYITEGPGNEMWYTNYSANRVGYINPKSGTPVELQLEKAGSDPNGMTVGPEEDLWFTDEGTGMVSKMTPQGKVTEYKVPEGFGHPYYIGKGPDGNIYFTDTTGAKVAKAIPATGQTSVVASLPSGSNAIGIAAGPDAALWYVNQRSSAAIGKITTGGVQPIEALAPKPSEAECPSNGVFVFGEPTAEAKERGCRALTFEYAKSTSARGEAEEEWGNYKGALQAVCFVAWNPSPTAKRMEAIEVAHYSYDNQGRLRAEWDPRYGQENGKCSSEPGAGKLKTRYGYDPEGHMTALSPSGQQPWIFTYGTSKIDTSPGRLVKLMRPKASASFWKGEGPPVDPQSLPALEGSPVVGNRMGVSNGVWYGEPAAYGYQWERCNTHGEACTPIPGATNQNYTPVEEDAGHTLQARVTATNAGGSQSALSAASALVEIPASQGGVIEYSLPPESNPGYITTGPDGNVWFTVEGYSNGKIGKITPSGQVTEYPLSSAIHPAGITSGPDGNLWFTAEKREGSNNYADVGKITTSGQVTEYPVPGYRSEGAIAVGPDGNLWFTHQGGLDKVTTSGAVSEYSIKHEGLQENLWGSGITAGPDGNLWLFYEWVSTVCGIHGGGCHDTWHVGIAKSTTTGALTEYEQANPGNSEFPEGSITVGSDSNLWFSKGAALHKLTTSGETTEYGLAHEPGAITSGPFGDLWFAWSHGIGKMTTQGQSTEYRLPGEAAANGIVTGPEGRLWVSEFAAGKIAKINPYLYEGPTPTPAREYGPQPGTTVEYGVSVSDYQSTAAYESVSPLWPRDSHAPLGDDAIAPNGDIWVADTGGSRVDEFSPKGEYLGDVGSSESAFVNAGCNSAMCLPIGVAVNPSGDLWVVGANGQLEEYTPERTLLHSFKIANSSILLISATLPWGIALEGGHVFVSFAIEDVVREYTEAGEYVKTFGAKGSGEGQFESPHGLAAANGNLWVTDAANNRVDECSIESGKCHTAFGPEGAPASQENTPWNNVTSAFGIDRGTKGQLEAPSAIAIDSSGDLWVADEAGDNVERFSPQGEYLGQYGYGAPVGKQVEGPRGVALNAEGGLVVANDGSPVLTVPRSVLETLTANDGLQPMTEDAVAAWAQRDVPVEGTAIIPPSEAQTWPATTYKRATVYYLDDPGRLVDVASPSNSPYGSVATTEYNEYNDVVRELSPENRIRSLEAGRERSAPLAGLLSTRSIYDGEGGAEELKKNPAAESEPGSELVEKIGPQHMVKLQEPEGTLKEEVLARERTVYTYDQEVIYNKETGRDEGREPPKEGETYHLLTATQTFADLEDAVLKNPQVEVRTTTTSYSGQNNLGWKLREPTSVTVAPELQYTKNPRNIKHETIYEPNSGQVTETRGPQGLSGGTPHDEKTVYYTAEANPEHEHEENRCGEHREWAGLVCMTLPAKEPKTESVSVPGLPEVRTVSYNVFDQPEVTEEVFKTETSPGVFKTTTRTKTMEYDAAGRAKSSKVTSSAPEAEAKKLPEVTYGYSQETGAQVSESAGGTTSESIFNTLGQMVEYKDGTGNTAHFSYEEGSGLLKELTDSAPTGGPGAYQRYTYNPMTEALTRLEDSQAGTFAASYNGAGQMTSELYPDGVCANYGFNEAEQAVHLEYVKSSTCKPRTNVWYSETLHPSIHGDTLRDENTLLSSEDKYDEAGRLEEVSETPAGKGCTVEHFVYTAESDREKQIKRAPEANGSCASKGGEEQTHRYDEGNRLTDEGVQYNSLGGITKMPEKDAGGTPLQTEYYADGQVASQSENGRTNSYTYGPAGKVMETTTESLSAPKKTTISQYDGPGQTVAWTCEGSGSKCEGSTFQRDIPGIDGSLCAVDESGTVTLQLRDLKGNIVETAEDNTTATEPLSKQASTTFGVPVKGEGKPQQFSFLGAAGIVSELPTTGVIVQGGTSYVPQSAITLQAEGAPPPGLPEGSGPLVTYALQVDPWAIADAIRSDEEEPGREATKEREAAAAARDPRCRLHVWVGMSPSSTGKEWVYARGEATCSGRDLPTYSELEVCLVQNYDEAAGPPEGERYCGGKGEKGQDPLAGAGYNPYNPHQDGPFRPVTRLYAHVHWDCYGSSSEVSWRAWGWFFVPGNRAEAAESVGGWRCSAGPFGHLEEAIEFDLEFAELPV